MALTDENGGMNTTMLVSPTGGYAPTLGGCQGGQNGWDNGWWIILLFILLASGNWGNQNNGAFGGAMPYVFNDNNGAVQRGFDQSAVMSGIGAVQNGINGLATQLCNCCGDMQMAVAGGFANAETAANARQMADMNQNFGLQTAMMQGFNTLGTQFADCCCENRLGLADLKYTVATENCADRQALNEGVRDIIASQTAGTQRILDQLCQDKIDEKNDTIAQLRQELLYSRGQASQDVQTAVLRQGQEAEVDALYNRLSNCPVPTTPVYGRQPIFTCNNDNSTCGCGM